MCYLIDFIEIAQTFHNFIRRTKLISSFLKEEIELIISKIRKFLFRSVVFHGIFWSGNSLVLGYSLFIEQSKISYSQDLSALRQLKLLEFHFWTPSEGLHHQAPYRAPWIPAALGKHITYWLRDDLLTLFFLLVFKMSSSQNYG